MLMGPRIKVLVVDDEPFILSALKRLLVRRGFEVDTASCGQQALDNLERIRPDVVVSDFTMPGMNGAELLAELAARLPQVRRILLSGRAVTSTSVGATFLPKPWDEAELLGLCRLGRLS